MKRSQLPLLAIALSGLTACAGEPARITAIQSAQAPDFVPGLGRCEADRGAPVNFVVLSVSGRPEWYARIAFMADNNATLRWHENAVDSANLLGGYGTAYFGDLLEGAERDALLARGDFNESVREPPRAVIVCCPREWDPSVSSDAALSVDLEYARQTQTTANTLRLSDFMQACETPDVTLSPMPSDYITVD